MDVILLEKITNLGDLGSQVTVKPGYGRNFLVPQGKAVPATEENIKIFEGRRAEVEKKSADSLAAAQSRAEKLKELSVVISSKAGDEGKLFGSVGTRDVAEAITNAGVEVAKSEVRMPEGVIRNVGEFDIDLQLHTDVTVTIKVNVVPEA